MLEEPGTRTKLTITHVILIQLPDGVGLYCRAGHGPLPACAERAAAAGKSSTSASSAACHNSRELPRCSDRLSRSYLRHVLGGGVLEAGLAVGGAERPGEAAWESSDALALLHTPLAAAR